MATIESDSGLSRQNPWTAYAYLVNQAWLRHAAKAILAFLHILIPAQAMILGGELFMTVVSKLALTQMNAQSLGFSNLILAGVYLLTGLVVGAPLLLYGFAKIIFRLTAFCRFWLMTDPLKADETENMKSTSADALQQLSARTKFLGLYWSFCSLWLILPILLLLVLVFIRISINPDLVGFRSPSELIVDGLLLLIVAFIITVSAFMFPIGAIQEGTPGRTALSTFAMSFRLFLPSIPFCILVVLLNVVSSSPEYLLKQVVGSAAVNDNLPISLILLVWQAAIGLLLMPASMLPFCELWKTTQHESK